MRWRFITINTKNSWLPGDGRGFRHRAHRIHSSGDYRNPPPAEEHAGLRHVNQQRSADKVVLPRDARPRIAKALLEALTQYRFKALSVASDHAHLLIELPDVVPQIKVIIGDAKRVASKAVGDLLPGTVWSAGCDYEPVDDPRHFDACEHYVLTKQGAGTWTWSFRDGGMWHEDRNR